MTVHETIEVKTTPGFVPSPEWLREQYEIRRSASRRALAEMWQEECAADFRASPLQHVWFKIRLFASRGRTAWAVICGRATVIDKLLP